MEKSANTKTLEAPQQKPAEEHVVKMWTPYDIKVDETYPYIPKPSFKKFSIGLKGFAAPILRMIDKIAFSLEIEGEEYARSLDGKGFITVCNHVNVMDCTMLGIAVNRKDIVLTTIKENFEVPVVRLFVTWSQSSSAYSGKGWLPYHRRRYRILTFCGTTPDTGA